MCQCWNPMIIATPHKNKCIHILSYLGLKMRNNTGLMAAYFHESLGTPTHHVLVISGQTQGCIFSGNMPWHFATNGDQISVGQSIRVINCDVFFLISIAPVKEGAGHSHTKRIPWLPFCKQLKLYTTSMLTGKLLLPSRCHDRLSNQTLLHAALRRYIVDILRTNMLCLVKFPGILLRCMFSHEWILNDFPSWVFISVIASSMRNLMPNKLHNFNCTFPSTACDIPIVGYWAAGS